MVYQSYKEDIKYIISLIDKSGCCIVKVLQRILPILEILDIDVHDSFKKYYDKCFIHDIKYTKQVS